ncbi:MAG: hypothetical protein K0R59_64 [Sphingobacterium sp.]|nr:hypothetical protein [Sphingobacterium sp.]
MIGHLTIEKVKVLQLGKFFPVRGGVEKVMYDLTLGLSEMNIHCDMLCASTEDYPAGTSYLNPYARLIVTPTSAKLAATMLSPAMVTTLRTIAKNYDIIHIHHPDPMATLALFFSGYKGKVVLHWHSDILKQKMLLKIYKPLQRWLIKRADHIVGTTPVYVQESPFLKKVQHKVDYIPIGVLPIQADPTLVSQLFGQYKGKHLIFSLGRLVAYKGYEYLIRSAQYLNEKYHILIGGKGPLLQPLQTLIETLGLQDRITLLGYMGDDDIAAHFAVSDVFCLSSIWKTEAFGIVQIEAMSCGVPLVSTDIPGSGVSWVNHHGYSGLVVPRENEEALAQSFKQICEDPVFKMNLSIGSQTRYTQCFTRDKMLQKCLSIYSKCLVENKTKAEQQFSSI